MLINLLNTYIFGPTLPIIVFGAGIFLLFRVRFCFFLHPVTVIGSFFDKSASECGISPLKSVMLALAGTLGVGNIVGVASAITVGGAGAVFWMVLSAIVAMAVKYSEIVLTMLYRTRDENGWHGGAYRYIAHGMSSPRLAAFFAGILVLCSFTLGQFIQSGSAASAVSLVTGLPKTVVGGAIAVLALLVIVGGVKRISDFTVRLVPFLSLAYIAASLAVILPNLPLLPGIFSEIMSDAFDVGSAVGGVGGFLLSKSVRYGVSRGILSNEAGSGTAPTAHAASASTSPVRQGFWGLFEVAVDTLLLCPMTAFVVLIYEKLNPMSGYDGMELVINSYGVALGRFSGPFIAFSVFCYAFATVVCWSYYGTEALSFITGSRFILKAYPVVYCLCALIGSAVGEGFVWELTDASVAVMTIVNTLSVVYLSGEVARETKKYFSIEYSPGR